MRVQQLEDFPFSGRKAPEYSSPRAQVRFVVKGKSKIYYRIDKREVHILAVIDTRQTPIQP